MSHCSLRLGCDCYTKMQCCSCRNACVTRCLIVNLDKKNRHACQFQNLSSCILKGKFWLKQIFNIWYFYSIAKNDNENENKIKWKNVLPLRKTSNYSFRCVKACCGSTRRIWDVTSSTEPCSSPPGKNRTFCLSLQSVAKQCCGFRRLLTGYESLLNKIIVSFSFLNFLLRLQHPPPQPRLLATLFFKSLFIGYK